MKRTLAAAAIAAATAVLFSGTVDAKDVLPESGALAPHTMQRLLLVDAARAGSRVVAVGDRGYVVTSDDQGATWKRSKSPEAPLLTSIFFLDDKRGWAVGHDSVILASADGGETWTRQFSAPAEQRPLLSVLFLDARHGFAVGAYGAFYETTDGGAKWTARKPTNDDKHLNAIVDAGKGHLVILGEAGTILRSADAGATWQPAASPYKGSLFGGIVARDGALVAFGLRGHIYRSTDAGGTWAQVPSVSESALFNGTLLGDGSIVLSGASGTVLRSRDNGLTFAAVPSGRRGVVSKVLSTSPGMLLLGEGGVRQLNPVQPAK